MIEVFSLAVQSGEDACGACGVLLLIGDASVLGEGDREGFEKGEADGGEAEAEFERALGQPPDECFELGIGEWRNERCEKFSFALQ